MTFGETMRAARQARNLSTREVEQACGISNAYLSQMENDKIKKPSPHFLKKLAKLYDANFEEFMQAASYIETAVVMVKCEVCGHYQRITSGNSK
jgi:transcriptional regulator with XRE-family HTH domain